MKKKRSRDSYIKFKNTADRVMAGAGLVILSPVMAGIAIAIKVEEGISAPVFFKQKRGGINKSHFMLYKFRSMRADTPHDMPTHLLQDPEQYLTKTGKWLRKTSLDELPQLINVIKGDMTIIGPRPPLPSEVAMYTEHQKIRLLVTPGLTCIWQVQPHRNDIPFGRWVEMDIDYILHRNLAMDISIVFKTILAMIRKDGE